MIRPPRVWIGWDVEQARAWDVAALSCIQQNAPAAVDVRRLALPDVRAAGLYYRPMMRSVHGYYDKISEAPMSTGHAIARFLVPRLAEYSGWALFTDGDVLFRRPVDALFALADPRFAVQVVQHPDYVPPAATKMEGQVQTRYPRKNWSSVILFNCGHPANAALTPALVNTLPGRDLHRFCWLDDALVGALPPEWNVLLGRAAPAVDPAIAHFTEGLPDLPGYEHAPFAGEWYQTAFLAGHRVRQPALAAVPV
jgi:hypothetical protein